MRYVQWSAKQLIDRCTARIRKHQRHAVVVARQRDGSRRPRIVQIVLQFVFVSEAIEAVQRRVLRSGKHNQERVAVVIGAIAPSPAEDAVAVLPHHPEAIVPANVEPRGSVHPPLHCQPAIALRRGQTNIRPTQRMAWRI
jgi:hypothetical protein